MGIEYESKPVVITMPDGTVQYLEGEIPSTKGKQYYFPESAPHGIREADTKDIEQECINKLLEGTRESAREALEILKGNPFAFNGTMQPCLAHARLILEEGQPVMH